MKNNMNFRKTAAVAVALAMIAMPTAQASVTSASNTIQAADSEVINGSLKRYQQSLPNEFKMYMDDGSVWEGKGSVRKSFLPKRGSSVPVTLTPKGSKWVVQFEGSNRKYTIARIK